MAMLRAGASLQQVALACDLHTRTVSLYREQIEAEAGSRQGKLPL
jgi:DNA-binding CsgD family transcriptional regulator